MDRILSGANQFNYFEMESIGIQIHNLGMRMAHLDD